MKNGLLLTLLLTPLASYCQFTAAFHQSNLPFVAVNYEFKNRFKPELRLGTDANLEDVSAELVGLVDVLDRAEFEVYAGFGLRSGGFDGIVIPAGVNFYPFATKNFGFHLEVAPVFSEPAIFRGSWGIRYRFRKESE